MKRGIRDSLLRCRVFPKFFFTSGRFRKKRGVESVFAKVGSEPTGDSFNSIVKLETSEQNR